MAIAVVIAEERPEGVAVVRVSDPEEEVVKAVLRRGDSPHTRRAYAGDLRVFRSWLEGQGLEWRAATRADLHEYREYLRGTYARATVNRRLQVVRALYAEAVEEGLLSRDPARRLEGVKGRDDRDGGALTRTEARTLLDAIAADRARPGRELIGLRDYALLGLLVRTGLRRSEATALRVADLGTAQGHAVATIRNGKGGTSRTAKLPPDLRRVLEEWLEASGLAGDPSAPVFVEVTRWGRIAPERRPLDGKAVYRIVRRRLEAAGLPVLSPHALRASFVTLALEGGAPLHVVQHAAGHADPRTTVGYWRRKTALDDNGVDYLHGLDL